jgi:hypothetical protein
MVSHSMHDTAYITHEGHVASLVSSLSKASQTASTVASRTRITNFLAAVIFTAAQGVDYHDLVSPSIRV